MLALRLLIDTYVNPAFLVLGLLLTALVATIERLECTTFELGLTNKRTIRKHGIIHRHTLELSLAKLVGIKVTLFRRAISASLDARESAVRAVVGAREPSATRSSIKRGNSHTQP